MQPAQATASAPLTTSLTKTVSIFSLPQMTHFNSGLGIGTSRGHVVQEGQRPLPQGPLRPHGRPEEELLPFEATFGTRSLTRTTVPVFLS